MKKTFPMKFAQHAFFLVSLIILTLIIASFSKEFIQTREINQEISSLQKEIQDLEEQNRELEALIKYFDSESYAERKARMELGLKKPDEEVIIIQNIPDNPLNIFDEKTNDEEDEIPNPLKWWRYFFKRSYDEK